MNQEIKNNPVKILLVEDNPGDVAFFREMLGEINTVQLELTHCNTLSSALISLSKGSFGIILLDLSLPDGKEIDTVVRMNAAAPHVPIVVMSGLGDEELAVRSLHEGAQDYLVKGHVDSNLLIRAMRYAIERKQTEDALQKAHDVLELRVRERTAELIRANEQLREEIEDRKQTAHSLREALAIIKKLKNELHEENIYLKEEVDLLHSHADIVETVKRLALF